MEMKECRVESCDVQVHQNIKDTTNFDTTFWLWLNRYISASRRAIAREKDFEFSVYDSWSDYGAKDHPEDDVAGCRERMPGVSGQRIVFP